MLDPRSLIYLSDYEDHSSKESLNSLCSLLFFAAIDFIVGRTGVI